jgi:DNA repair protein RAD57
MLRFNPLFSSSSPLTTQPSLDHVLSIPAEDLEAQDHILTYQVPVAVRRRNVGLLVVDSVAANYRAEFDRGAGSGAAGGGGDAGGAGGGGNRSANMAARSVELVKLGALLRDLARTHNLAVVVANQVADRFSNDEGVSGSSNYRVDRNNLLSSRPLPPPTSASTTLSRGVGGGGAGGRGGGGGPGAFPGLTQESPLASRSRPSATAGAGSMAPPEMPEPSSSIPEALLISSMPDPPDPDSIYGRRVFHLPGPSSLLALELNHQQRWFTGWGDDPLASTHDLKTPSLGLVWSTQIACRIALFRRPAIGRLPADLSSAAAAEGRKRPTWRRWMKVVFAPHVAPSGPGLSGAVEFEITMGGLRAVEKGGRKNGNGDGDGDDYQ